MKNYFLLKTFLLVSISSISIAQWTSVGGPEGGEIAAITNAGSYIVCGAADGDIFTSVDNGTTWTARGNVPGTFLTRLVAGSEALFARSSNGLYRSTDQGDTWALQLDPGVFIGKVFANGTQVLAPTGNGLFYSTNSGTNWTNVTGNLPMTVHAAVIHNGDMYAGMLDSAVYKSTNNGATWFRAWNITTRRDVNFLATFGNTIYAAHSSEARLFSSTDNGLTWTQSDILAIGAINEYVNDLLVTSSGIYVPLLYQTSFSLPWGGGVYVSTNGTSWSFNNDGLIPRWIDAVASSQGDVLAATRGGGIFRSTNQGQSWNSSSAGLVKSRVLHLSYTNGGQKFYSSIYGGGFFVSEDSAQSWQSRNTGFENIFSLPVITQFLIKGTSWFAGTEDDGLYKSTNEGTSWFKSGMDPFVFTGLAVRGNDLFATQAVTDGVFRSTDDGFSWTQIMGGFTTFSPTCLAIGGAGTIFVGIYEGSILRSTNNGTNWLGSFLGGGAIPRYIRFIGSTMFAGTSNGVYRSTNFGINWTPSNNGMQGIDVNFIAIQDTNTLFAATSDSGMYVSLDNGNNWFAWNDGLPTLELVGVRSTGTHLYCGTKYYGILRRPINNIVTEVNENSFSETPSDFVLKQNYPNPFNPGTHISWRSPMGSWQTLKVYDLLGREVATLVDEYKRAGSYQIEFDASGLPSGIYFYKLQAGSFIQTKKMIVIK
jgi:hypothetical protein